jgi:hypothetical protein
MKAANALSQSWLQYSCAAGCPLKESRLRRGTPLFMNLSRLRKNYCGVSTPFGREIVYRARLDMRNIPTKMRESPGMGTLLGYLFKLENPANFLVFTLSVAVFQ